MLETSVNENKFIPPKGIKRKNQEGYEMLDFICPDDAQEDDYQNLFDNLFSSQIDVEEGADGNLSESDLSSSDEYLHDAATAVQPDESEIETTGSGIVPLSKLSNDPDINKDAMFLDSMAKVIEMESEIFLGYLRKFQSVYDEARRSVKKV